MNIQKYVLVYAYDIYRPTDFVAIRKLRPAWQEGKINLPGGHVEEGEDYLQAAMRELHEETDIDPSLCAISYGGRIFGDDWNIEVWRAGMESDTPIRTMTDERVFRASVEDMLLHRSLMPNLRIALPLLALRSPFEMRDNERYDGSDKHTVTLTTTHIPIVRAIHTQPLRLPA